MKTVMLLGGTKGVGFEILKSCVSKGYAVAFCGRNKAEGQQILKSLGAEDRLYFHELDLNSNTGLKDYYDGTIEKFKSIDSLIVYAGITPFSPILDIDEETYDSVFNVNLKAPFFLLKYVLKSMIEQNSGSIVFFGSAHMECGEQDRTAYALTKGALNQLSTHIARHYSKYGIRSNYLIMGWTNTEGEITLRQEAGVSEEALKSQIEESIPMGRMLNPTDPVPMVMHLISDDSLMTTGSIIRVTGGQYI
ncbi:SDR family NAD(P)-dependent oxidoreductase [Winogradskyella aurantia]|uniref:Short-chain dehydrogenase n=1 Tax=Winogradskyella aurantia TaxID=1915063 RepID=A0A265UXC9_9FLAO|nr:SDR family oxidoreductase [Winogradskyella aurantia]OZV69882.1 short-chain dehydrogenase [Winogradskyella aurantia]